MPLSDDDRRKFEEIEKALRDEDPVFSTTVSLTRLRRRNLLRAIACFCIGIILLVVGLVSTQGSVTVGVAIAVAGFLVMVGAAAHFFRPRPRSDNQHPQPVPPS